MYQSAANAFKLDKLFKEAGDAYAREAECREQDKQREQAANAWWNAAQVYQRAENYDCECYIDLVVVTSVKLVYSGYSCVLPCHHFPN